MNCSPCSFESRAPVKLIRIAFVYLALLMQGQWSFAQAERPRLAVLTDIGGDPDDQQSLIRLLVYSNEFQLELLIASAAGTRGGAKECCDSTGSHS